MDSKLAMDEVTDEDLDWEEWDGQTPFWSHCVAGGIAGVAEHTLLYPVDTVKTHMQSYCADCPHHPAAQQAAANGTSKGARVASMAARSAVSPQVAGVVAADGMWKTFSQLVYNPVSVEATSALRPVAQECAKQISGSSTMSLSRLWTGVQTMMVGCAPAHALYFSSYEVVKHLFESSNDNAPSTVGNMAAGATATAMHDCVMTPLDTMKQRLQLGHYRGKMTTAFLEIVRLEGVVGLYRSLGITLLTNIPYGMIMVPTNEYLKHQLTSESQQPATISTYLISGSGAGAVASAVTTPLDRLKTRLQTQAMGSALAVEQTRVNVVNCEAEAFAAKCHKAMNAEPRAASQMVRYHSWADAYRSIVAQEGYAGLFRGLTPRVLTHMPAVAISWTTYETVKHWLVEQTSSV